MGSACQRNFEKRIQKACEKAQTDPPENAGTGLRSDHRGTRNGPAGQHECGGLSIKWCLASGAKIYDGVDTKAGDMASFRILHQNPGTYFHEIQRIEGARVESLLFQVTAVSSQLKKSLKALTKQKRRKPQPKKATAKGKK
jgi:hypothetical protein